MKRKTPPPPTRAPKRRTVSASSPAGGRRAARRAQNQEGVVMAMNGNRLRTVAVSLSALALLGTALGTALRKGTATEPQQAGPPGPAPRARADEQAPAAKPVPPIVAFDIELFD